MGTWQYCGRQQVQIGPPYSSPLHSIRIPQQIYGEQRVENQMISHVVVSQDYLLIDAKFSVNLFPKSPSKDCRRHEPW